MKKIEEYVELMFKELPKTKKVEDIKNNIISTMEEKYADLLEDGKTEKDALDSVLSDFGDIEELKKEFEFGVDNSIKVIQKIDVEKFISDKKKVGRSIALGVFLIINGVGISAFFSETRFEYFAYVAMYVLIAISVGLFVYNSFNNSKLNDNELGLGNLDENQKTDVIVMYGLFNQKFAIAITSGVVLCILGATSPILIEEILHLGENVFAIVLFPFVATGVYLFVYFSIVKGGFEKLLNGVKVKEERKLEWVYEITMPLATMIFLIIGFITDVWHPTWIVFPISACITEGIILYIQKSQNIR